MRVAGKEVTQFLFILIYHSACLLKLPISVWF